MEFGSGPTRNPILRRTDATHGEFKTIIFKNTSHILKDYLQTSYVHHVENVQTKTNKNDVSNNFNCSNPAHRGPACLKCKPACCHDSADSACAQLAYRMIHESDFTNDLTPIDYDYMTHTMFGHHTVDKTHNMFSDYNKINSYCLHFNRKILEFEFDAYKWLGL